ncbi:hypothetical protein ACLB2K_008129 [Fragaria x ananassa]
MCWQIWKARNTVIFQSASCSHVEIVHALAAIGASYRAHLWPVRDARDYPDDIKWHPPPPCFVKINFDGSVVPNRGAATGFIIYDHNDNPLIVGSRNIGNAYVPVVECSALKDGLREACRFNHLKIQIEGDLTLIINCIKGRCTVPWRIKSFIGDIVANTRWCTSIFFDYVFREANFLADTLATLRHSFSSTKI